MFLDELKEAFLHSRKHGLSGARCAARPATLAMYRENIGHFIRFLNERGRNRYEDVTRADIRAFVEFVNSNAAWSSKATKFTRLRAVRTLFRFVETDEECVSQKLRGWAHLLPRIPRNPRREFIPTSDKLKALRSLWDTSTLYGLRNYAVFNLIIGTGLRVGEVCWLRMEHLQLAQNTLIVPKEGKTGVRMVPVEDAIVALLQVWLRRRSKISGIEACPWVFVARGLRRCTPNTFGQAFRKLQPGLKDTRTTAHGLRHAYGTLYLRNGGDIEQLRLNMGHSTYDTTMNYLHVAKAGTQRAKDELERVSPLKAVLAGK